MDISFMWNIIFNILVYDIVFNFNYSVHNKPLPDV